MDRNLRTRYGTPVVLYGSQDSRRDVSPVDDICDICDIYDICHGLYERPYYSFSPDEASNCVVNFATHVVSGTHRDGSVTSKWRPSRTVRPHPQLREQLSSLDRRSKWDIKRRARVFSRELDRELE